MVDMFTHVRLLKLMTTLTITYDGADFFLSSRYGKTCDYTDSDLSAFKVFGQSQVVT